VGLFVVVALSASLGPVAAGRAQVQARGADAPLAHARLLLNQKRIEIGKLIELVSKETGRTILYDDQVRGTVSLVAKRPVTADEAWEILGSALHMLGYSLLPSTVGQWRISRVAEAVGESPFVASAKRTSDLFVTALIPLERAGLQSVMNVLQPLGGSGVTLIPVEMSRSLIASGPERAIARLTAIADELDRVEERALRQRVLRYRSVLEVEPMIALQLDAGALADGDLELWSDERTNSLIFRGGDEATDRLRAFLDEIDRPVEGAGEIRVLRVLNRDAADIAEILGGRVPSGGRSRSKAGEDEQDRSGVDAVDDAPTLEDEGDASRTQSREGARNGTGGPSAAPDDAALGGAPSAPDVGFAGGAPIDLTALLGGEDHSIAVDEPTRSLVVRASERGHALIRELVEELDQRPQLIAVDVTISEVRTPSSWALALSYHVPILPGDELDEFVGRLISTPAGGGFSNAPIDEGALFGRVSRDADLDFEIPGEGGVSVPLEDTGQIDASSRRAVVDILLQPSLIVVAGEEHELFVGSNIPIPVTEGANLGSGTTTGGLVVPSVSVRFDRQDIGVRMNIQAKAGREGPITLDLETEISNIGPPLAGDPAKVGPTLLKQVLSARARLDDGETAVLGVDRENREIDLKGGTPWLSDIPFLGWLFKARGAIDSDVRIVIAARARRLSTPAELVADTIRRRLAFDRQRAREENLPSADSPYGVRVTTRAIEDDALAIAADLERRGHRAKIQRWRSADGRALFDVYVMGLDSMADAGDLAWQLSEDGWDADLVVFSARASRS